MNDLYDTAHRDMDVRVLPDRAALGAHASADIAAAIRERLASRTGLVRMVFAAAPSQQETLHALRAEPGIDWSRVIAFHMDEYVGLPAAAPQRFGNWLQHHFFAHLPFGAVNLIEPGDGPDAMTRETARYAALLAEAPIDIVCMGIGVNGHLAFNDPPVADFHDPLDVKTVLLDDVCRQQQVDDLCFASFADVPERAVTLTIPRLLRCDRIFCMVPGSAKQAAVIGTLRGAVSVALPATILRQHPDCRLYLDADSAPADGQPV